MVKVSIDRNDCISCANCWTICPEFFEQNSDDSFSQVVKMYRVGGNIAEGEAPQKIEGVVKEAADSCPVQIIHVT
ncbi:pyruvate ferredoxin oxidoreductase delta subunit [Methanosarcinales archaeon]|nr:pyruvate ferredoxin oxidoreductase delta subunit [Methanosarcinales archaeon]